MINLVIAYDDNDSSLAEYFESSYQYVSDFTAPIDTIISYPIPGLNCTEDHISQTIQGLNGERFCFVGFSHGNCDMLLTDNDVYVNANNCTVFNQSVFYSLGCQTALTLGEELISQGCTTFVGYYDDSYATFEQFNDTYISCENFALREFLTRDVTLGEAFDSMMENYEIEIEKMIAANEILMAMELIHNKDCMDILGDEGVRAHQLHF